MGGLVMPPMYTIENSTIKVTGILTQLRQEKFAQKILEYANFYLQKGENYIQGYLSSFENNPVRKLIAKNIMCNKSAKYEGAKLALEKLVNGGKK